CTKVLATPEQTTIGKENSNPLIADSLLKTIRLSMHLVLANHNEALTSPWQTAHGKEISNPLIADDLLKIIW
ncbi:hypothetical protein Tco_0301392, partial [Tanacetum coccineum]